MAIFMGLMSVSSMVMCQSCLDLSGRRAAQRRMVEAWILCFSVIDNL